MLDLLFESDDDVAEPRVGGPVIEQDPNIKQDHEANVLRHTMINSARIRHIQSIFLLI